ncbi:MAG: TnpV protein [Subdoligranulum sp.]|nr:TnpV protein [Subdoligranulum sp.]
MEITYRNENGYLLPNLDVDSAPPLGKYGRLRRNYLRQHQNGIYTGMWLSGKLDAHLQEIDQQAQEMVEQMIQQMAHRQNVDEWLKASDPLRWVGMMNNIKAAAEEVVLNDLIYV